MKKYPENPSTEDLCWFQLSPPWLGAPMDIFWVIFWGKLAKNPLWRGSDTSNDCIVSHNHWAICFSNFFHYFQELPRVFQTLRILSAWLRYSGDIKQHSPWFPSDISFLPLSSRPFWKPRSTWPKYSWRPKSSHGSCTACATSMRRLGNAWR